MQHGGVQADIGRNEPCKEAKITCKRTVLKKGRNRAVKQKHRNVHTWNRQIGLFILYIGFLQNLRKLRSKVTGEERRRTCQDTNSDFAGGAAIVGFRRTL